jgi:rhamnosyltransferase
VNAKVVAVVVTFQPDQTLIEAVHALKPQVSSVLVVDNGSDGERLRILQQLRSAFEPMLLGKNLGVGAAHNVGIARARKLGATHVLLMDQDSIARPGMVENMLAAEMRLISSGNRVGALGPVYHDPRLGKSWPFYRMSRLGVNGHGCTGEDTVPCDFLISSGTLVRIAVIDEVGAMNEGYFLEHVDTEWSLRARSRGYALFGVCSARMNHRLGDEAARVPLSDRHVQIYQPYRHYYLFRNSLLLWREHYAKFPWKVNELRRLVARIVYFSLFVPPRLERLRFMVLGIWHGILGRAGPLRA